MTSKLLTGAFALVLAAASSLASAGVDDQMRGMFNSTMVNATPPSISTGGRRGLITGGNFSMRNQDVNIGSVVSFDPPRIGSAGCGGIDAYGGAISFLSSDRLEEMLKAVPSMAASYAFSLGMQAISPTIGGEIDKYVKMLNDLVGDLTSSCAIAQAIVDPFKDRIQNTAANAAVALGIQDDHAQTRGNGDDPNTGTQAMSEHNPVALSKIQPGNVVWRALKQRSVGGWVGSSNDDLLQDLMAFTGTIIVCHNGTAGCNAVKDTTSGERDESPLSHTEIRTLSLRDLVEGSANGGPGGKAVETFRCVGGTANENQCLGITRTPTTIVGMRERILNIATGNNPSGGSGLVGRYAMNPSTTPTSDEVAFLNASGAYGQMIFSLIKYNRETAATFAHDFAGLIAAQIVNNYISNMLHAIETAVGNTDDKGMRDKTMELIRDARYRLEQDLRSYDDVAKGRGAMYAQYETQLRLTNPAVIPPRPALTSQ